MNKVVGVRLPTDLRQALERQAEVEIKRATGPGPLSKRAELIRVLLAEGLQKRGAYAPTDRTARMAA
jgi:predicted nucleic acid-binding Zn ribbon protein